MTPKHSNIRALESIGLSLFQSANDHVALIREANRNVNPSTVCFPFEGALGLRAQLTIDKKGEMGPIMNNVLLLLNVILMIIVF